MRARQIGPQQDSRTPPCCRCAVLGLLFAVSTAPVSAQWLDPTTHLVRSSPAVEHGQRAIAGDMDGNGSMDLICSYSLTDEVDLELNLGGGLSWQSVDVSPDGTPSLAGDIPAMFAAPARIDGDADLDIVAVGLFDRACTFCSPGTVVWYERGATVSDWTTHVIDDTLIAARYLDLGDIDGDTDIDIVVAASDDFGLDPSEGLGNAVVWYENLGGNPVTWQRWTIAAGLSNPESVRLVNVDGGNGLEALVAEYAGDRLAWFDSGNAPRQDAWTMRTIDTGLGGPTSARPYAMDGDADLDVLVALHDAGSVVWYEAPADPVNDPWTLHTITASTNAVELVRADFSGDGVPDIAVAGVDWGSGTGQLEYLIDNGVGGWTSHAYNYFWIDAVDAADVDGDGDMDALTASYDGHRVDWWENPHAAGEIFSDGFESGDTTAW